MVIVSLRNTLHRFRTLQHHRPFSYYRITGERQRRRVDKALRILDIVSTRKDIVARGGGNHLRLIEDFLRTDFDQSHGDFRIRDCISVEVEASSVSGKPAEPSPENDEEFGVFGAVVLSNAVSSCVSIRDLRGGVQYHCSAVATGFVANAYVGSSLITLYSKCGELSSALKVFDEMPVRNVVSWTAIISGFAQEWYIDMCLELYSEMRNSALGPNDFTFTSLLSACSGSGALGQGRSVHCQAFQMGFDSYLHVANTLISMYCKCGSLEDALFIFKDMGNNRDIVSWNSMIAGYAQHGLAVEAIELFEEMKNQGKLKPDTFTFLGVLSSCRHVGFVEMGKLYFNSMAEYEVMPELDHYACLVDLLGRAGLLEEARGVIEGMPVPPNAVIWGSLLSSCRHHGSILAGIQAAEQKLSMEPECAATHLQLANLYAGMKCWGEAARVRKLMKDGAFKTSPGHSWIEIKNVVNRFRAEDGSNARFGELLEVLGSLADHMRALGFVPEI
ncbi:Pentatricopeptide repeat-containing protein At2g37320 [Linum perenne]